MKRRMAAILAGIVLVAGLILGGKALYRVFVTDRIMDKDGMINPDALEEFTAPGPDNTETIEE